MSRSFRFKQQAFYFTSILPMLFVILFLFLTSIPARADEIIMAGCDIGFDSGNGKPKVMCTNPKISKEEMRAFERL